MAEINGFEVVERVKRLRIREEARFQINMTRNTDLNSLVNGLRTLLQTEAHTYHVRRTGGQIIITRTK